MSPLQRRIRRRAVRHSIKLGPARLYLDDIDDICTSLREHAAEVRDEFETPLVIQAGDAVADETDDLRQATKEELDSILLYLPGDSPISVSFGRIRAQIEVEAADLKARALAEDIQSFILGRRSSLVPLRMYPHIDYTVLALIFALVAGGGLSLIIGARWTPIWTGYAVSAALLAVATFAMNFAFARRNGAIEVLPVRRSEDRGFTRQARRDLVVITSGTLIGAVLAGFLGLWQGLFAK